MFQSKPLVLLIASALIVLSADLFAQDWLTDLLVKRTPSYTEEGGEACLGCHSGQQMRTVENGPHGDEENPLTPAAQHECESCHGKGSIHVSRAHGGKGFPPLVEFGFEPGAAPRDEQVEACQGCHADEESGIQVALFEGTVHDHWVVSCSSCHAIHVDEDPVSNRSTQAEVCLSCHKDVRENHPKVGRRVPNFDRMGCAGCHKVHRLPKPDKQEQQP